MGSEQTEFEIKNIIPLILTPKINKNKDIKLTIYEKELYEENHKTLMNDIKEKPKSEGLILLKTDYKTTDLKKM